MAKETKVWKILKEAGFEPIEDLTIIVKYAPANLSAKITDFFHMDFYVFQLCKDEIVFGSHQPTGHAKKRGSIGNSLFYHKICGSYGGSSK